MKRILHANGVPVRPGHNEVKDEHERMPKASWEKMDLSYRGNVAEMIQVAGGKFTKMGGDPGSPRKPRGEERGYDVVDQPLTDLAADHLANPFDKPLSSL